jgi:hypothetical protein
MTQQVPQQVNSSFSAQLPTLQLAWDSTSLGAFKSCPRLYQYSILLGYTSRHLNVHLAFGLWTHSAREVYDHARAQGKSHDEGVTLAVRKAMELSWDRELRRPWASDDKNKNRWTLIRTLVWFLDQFENDPIQTIILANGKPAVELSFRFHTHYQARATGETYLYCGHLDRVGTLGESNYIVDIKTSKHTIDQGFFAKYTPDNQFTGYTLGAKVALSIPVKGLIVDAAQVAVTFSRFERGLVERTPDQVEEWYNDLGHWLRLAEVYAEKGYWPQNDKACQNYGGCAFQGICSKSPTVRDKWLNASFAKRVWDPLQVRGDI